MTDTVVYVGLGSNLGNPIQQVQRALQTLATIANTHILTHSSLYQSTPLGSLEQPDYVNAVAMLVTALSPIELLRALQTIEQQQGRIRTTQRWDARTLDLDILLFGEQRLQNSILTVPHSGLYERNFVLYPLYECNPDLLLPNGQLLCDWLQRVSPSGLCKLNV